MGREAISMVDARIVDEVSARSVPRRRAASCLLALLLALTLCLTAGCSDASTSGGPSSTSDPAISHVSEDISREEALAGAQGDAPVEAEQPSVPQTASSASAPATLDSANLPQYQGDPYVVVANNVPGLSPADASRPAETYAPLDAQGRCGTCVAVVSRATQPTEKRGSIGMVKPTGWHTVRYDDLVDGRYLYNRCHLIGYQLTGENANRQNLVTGTRYLNVEGMLPFEDKVDDYVDATGNSVIYRVTPVFAGDELVCRGVQMEAFSVEDNGAGVSFNVYCFNVQPGVTIDYATGQSRREDGKPASGTTHDAGPAPAQQDSQGVQASYVVNANTGKFHDPSCSSVSRMAVHNRLDFQGTRDEALRRGWEPCQRCNP